jgi:outer membrane protein assembly factor BamA
MRLPFCSFALVLAATSPLALAQTYTPKAIRIDAPSGVDTAEALRVVALKPGSLTKDQINAALQRLADTGMFDSISYKVNDTALTISLTPSADSQLQPAVFSNFVWWQPAQLESLVEARVPEYHGKLPAAGTLTDQVEAALVALLKEKGIDAKVGSRESRSATTVTLDIAEPEIVIGELQLQGALPGLAHKLSDLQHRLQGQDFDLGEANQSIHDTVDDDYQNAGYLDVSTSPLTYSAPHKDLNAYATNLTAMVQPGAQYHVAALTIQPAPPISQADLEAIGEIKIGDPASPMQQRIAAGEMARPYQDLGYLDARAAFQAAKDSAAHTVSYDVTIAPGDIYHFAGIDVSAFTPAQQAGFHKAFHVAPGAVAGKELMTAIRNAALDAHLGNSLRMEQRANRANHTVAILLKPAN